MSGSIKNQVLELGGEAQRLRRAYENCKGIDDDMRFGESVNITNMAWEYEKIIDKLLRAQRRR